MTLKVDLSADLEGFVDKCITEGRFADANDVVSSSLSLLRDQEARKEAFMAMLKEAEAEAERDGYFTVEEVMAEIDEIIDAVELENRSKATAE